MALLIIFTFLIVSSEHTAYEVCYLVSERPVHPQERPARYWHQAFLREGKEHSTKHAFRRLTSSDGFSLKFQMWHVIYIFFGHWRLSIFYMWFSNYGMFGFLESYKDYCKMSYFIIIFNFCTVFLSETFFLTCKFVSFLFLLSWFLAIPGEHLGSYPVRPLTVR